MFGRGQSKMKELFKLRETAYSKLHYSYDQLNKQAFLFFAVDPTAFQARGYNVVSLFNAKMLRYARDFPYATRSDPVISVQLNEIASDQIDLNSPIENLIFLTGKDFSVQEGIKYDYEVILEFNVEDISDSVKHEHTRPKLSHNAGNFSFNTYKSAHFMPTLKYEKGVIIPEFSSLEVGMGNFKSTTVDNMMEYISSALDENLINKKTEMYLKHSNFEKVIKFSENKYDSTIDQLAGLQTSTAPSKELEQTSYDVDNYLKIHKVRSKQLIKLEYLYDYEEALTGNYVSAISEIWKPLTGDVVIGIDAGKSILVRVMNPGNISDRYFFITSESEFGEDEDFGEGMVL